MSKYHCKCGGLKLPDFESYKVGDEVNFMIQKEKVHTRGKLQLVKKPIMEQLQRLMAIKSLLKLV